MCQEELAVAEESSAEAPAPTPTFTPNATQAKLPPPKSGRVPAALEIEESSSTALPPWIPTLDEEGYRVDNRGNRLLKYMMFTANRLWVYNGHVASKAVCGAPHRSITFYSYVECVEWMAGYNMTEITRKNSRKKVKQV